MIRKVAAIVLSNVILLLVLLASAEWTLRHYFPINTHYMAVDGTLARYTGWGPVETGVDSGRRRFLCDNEHSLESAAVQPRILLIGDSLLDCNQNGTQPFSNTIPYLLQGKLGAQWDVYNLSAGGWGTDQEYLAYKHYGASLKPQLVVLFFTPGNDLYNNASSCAVGGLIDKPRFDVIDGRLTLREQREALSDSNRFRSFYRDLELFKRVALLKIRLKSAAQKAKLIFTAKSDTGFLRLEKYHQLAPSVTPMPAMYRDSWDVTEQILLQFEAEVRRDGSDFVIFYLPIGIPNLCDPHPQYPMGCIGYESKVVDLVCDGRSVLVQPLQQYNLLKGFGERHGIKILDAFDSLEPYSYKYHAISNDCLHFTDKRGSEHVADALAKHLLVGKAQL